MKGYWAIPVIVGIALMLGFPPIQSNAANPACEKIEELVAAGKMPAEVGAKLLEKVDCDTQVVKINTISSLTDEPEPDTACAIFVSGVLLFEVTDDNGELVLTLPNTVIEISSLSCGAGTFPPNLLLGTLCNVPLTGSFTEIDLILFPFSGGACL